MFQVGKKNQQTLEAFALKMKCMIDGVMNISFHCLLFIHFECLEDAKRRRQILYCLESCLGQKTTWHDKKKKSFEMGANLWCLNIMKQLSIFLLPFHLSCAFGSFLKCRRTDKNNFSPFFVPRFRRKFN